MTTQILVPVHTYPDHNSDPAAVHALAIAKHLEADLDILIHVVAFPDTATFLGRMVARDPSLLPELRRDCRTHGSAFLKVLENGAAQEGVTFRTSEAEGFVTEFREAVADSARYHDLTVIGLVAGSRDMRATAEAAIFSSGRPVIVVPEEVSPRPPEHVMIAWDGSEFAARAVADAQDFLRMAKTVTIASVTDEKPLPGDDLDQRLSDYLARREIRSEIVQLRAAGLPIADVLQAHAKSSGADLIVMGGFGHDRVRDFVLGGATRGILGNLQVPTLLSH